MLPNPHQNGAACLQRTTLPRGGLSTPRKHFHTIRNCRGLEGEACVVLRPIALNATAPTTRLTSESWFFSGRTEWNCQFVRTRCRTGDLFYRFFCGVIPTIVKRKLANGLILRHENPAEMMSLHPFSDTIAFSRMVPICPDLPGYCPLFARICPVSAPSCRFGKSGPYLSGIFANDGSQEYCAIRWLPNGPGACLRTVSYFPFRNRSANPRAALSHIQYVGNADLFSAIRVMFLRLPRLS